MGNDNIPHPSHAMNRPAAPRSTPSTGTLRRRPSTALSVGTEFSGFTNFSSVPSELGIEKPLRELGYLPPKVAKVEDNNKAKVRFDASTIAADDAKTLRTRESKATIDSGKSFMDRASKQPVRPVAAAKEVGPSASKVIASTTAKEVSPAAAKEARSSANTDRQRMSTRSSTTSLHRSVSLNTGSRTGPPRRDTHRSAVSVVSVVVNDPDSPLVPPPEKTPTPSLKRSTSLSTSTRPISRRSDTTSDHEHAHGGNQKEKGKSKADVMGGSFTPAPRRLSLEDRLEASAQLYHVIGPTTQYLVKVYKEYVAAVENRESTRRDVLNVIVKFRGVLDDFEAKICELPSLLLFSYYGTTLLQVLKGMIPGLLHNTKEGFKENEDNSRFVKPVHTGMAFASLLTLHLTQLCLTLPSEVNKPLPSLPDEARAQCSAVTSSKEPFSANPPSKSFPSTEKSAETEQKMGVVARTRERLTSIASRSSRKRGNSCGSATLPPVTPRTSDESSQPSSTTSSSNDQDDFTFISLDDVSSEEYDNRPFSGRPYVCPTELTLVDPSTLPARHRGSLLIQQSLADVINTCPDFAKEPELGQDALDITYSKHFPGVIIAASLERIVLRMCSNECIIDVDFPLMVFRCHKAFCTATELLEEFTKIYKKANLGFPGGWPDPLANMDTMQVKNNILNMITAWVTTHWVVGHDDDAIVPLRKFLGAECLAEGVSMEVLSPILTELEKLEKESKEHTGSLCTRRRVEANATFKREYERSKLLDTVLGLTLPNALLQGKFCDLHVLDMDDKACTKELARQLALKGSQMFRAIEPLDLMWFYLKPKEEHPVRAKKFAMEQYLSRFAHWVQSTILDEAQAKKRAKVVTFFVNLAHQLVKINEFAFSLHVWLGLQNCKLERLMMTCNAINKQAHERVTKLNALFGDTHYSDCIKRFRALRAESQAPCVPLMYPFQSRMTRIIEARPRSTPSKLDESKMLINVQYFSVLSDVVTEMETYHTLYPFRHHERFQQYLDFLGRPGGLDTFSRMQEKIKIYADAEFEEFNKLKDTASIEKHLKSSGFLGPGGVGFVPPQVEDQKPQSQPQPPAGREKSSPSGVMF